jgi:hypothetical protein
VIVWRHAGATTATVTGSGTTYNVAVSGMTTAGSVICDGENERVRTMPPATATPLDSTDNTVTYDATAPTVTINQAAGQAIRPSVADQLHGGVQRDRLPTSRRRRDALRHGRCNRRPPSLAAARPTTWRSAA